MAARRILLRARGSGKIRVTYEPQNGDGRHTGITAEGRDTYARRMMRCASAKMLRGIYGVTGNG